MVILPILALQESITYTASMTGQQANLGYMVVIITMLGALAISTVEYVIAQTITVALAVYTLHLLIAEPISSESFTTWVAVLTVAVAGATNLHFARRSGLRHLADAQWALEVEANEDRLTGLAGRRGLDRAFPELLEQARRLSTPVFALFVDVDGLKKVNDTAGHDAGDTVIDVVAESLRRHCRSTDVVCRWGGDEFVVVGLGTGPDPSRFELVVSDHLSVINPAPDAWSGRVSVGHASLHADDAELLVLLGRADDDMYQRRAERQRHPTTATHSD
jgi:diguanylate cyclase (GGDEF)-like protein